MFLDKARLGLFGQLCRLDKSNPIVCVGKRQLALKTASSNSWFIQLRKVTKKYGMEDPAVLLQYPPSKHEWKMYCKTKVNSYWTNYFQNECKRRKSLEFFNPDGMSVFNTHPIYSSCMGDPYQTSKAIVQAKMVSGRYPIEKLAAKFKNANPTDADYICKVCDSGQVETLIHALLHCKGTQAARNTAMVASKDKLKHSIYLSAKWENTFASTDHTITQFLLDPTSYNLVPEMRVCLKDKSDVRQMFYVTRLWCYSINRARRTLLRKKE